MKSKGLVILMLVFASLVIPCLAWAADSASGGTKANKNVNLDFRDVPVQSAIRMLFDGTGLSYNFEPGVSGNVNMKLVDVPFKDALDKVLQSANLQLTEENDVYSIGPKKDQITEVTPDPNIKIDEPVLQPKLVVEKITIGSSSLVDVLSTLLGGGIMGGSAYTGNSGQMGGSMGGFGSSGMGGSMGGFGSSGMGGSGMGGFGSSMGGTGMGGFGSSGFGSSGFGSSGFGGSTGIVR